MNDADNTEELVQVSIIRHCLKHTEHWRITPLPPREFVEEILVNAREHIDAAIEKIEGAIKIAEDANFYVFANEMKKAKNRLEEAKWIMEGERERIDEKPITPEEYKMNGVHTP